LGIAGVCWNVEIVSLKVTDHLGRWEGPELVEALEYAEEIGIPLVNISLHGGDVPDLENSIEAYSGLVICSAGNSGGDLSVAPHRQYPAAYDCENMIVVGSAASDDTVADHSNFNSTMVDLFAPGVDMISTYPIVKCQTGNCGGTHIAEGYHTTSGTSYSTPLVAGVAALVLAQNPTYTPAQIKSRILNSVDEVDALDGYCVTGGRLNAFNALHSHSYTYRYVSLGQSGHNAYCSCGDYVVDTHLFVTSGGGTRCSKCNYRLN
jgi:subtilisin family serine protease